MQHHRHVILIGGYGNGDYQKGCYRYNISTDDWDEMPELNIARSRASSLYIDGRIYVVGGVGVGGVAIQSIERLTIDVNNQEDKFWKEIHPSNIDPNFTPRAWPLVGALNNQTIVILGGETDEQTRTNDVFYLDTRNLMLRQVEAQCNFTYSGRNNACVRVKDNHVVALVETDDNPHLISYELGSNRIQDL